MNLFARAGCARGLVVAVAALLLSSSSSLAQATPDGAFAGLAVSSGAGTSVTEYRVADFDPARDVPAMANWVPETDFEGGAAHCFAMTMLTYYVWKRVEFVEGPGLPASEWTASTPADTPVALDEDGLLFVMEWVMEERDRKVRVGGAADLRAATADGEATEELFRKLAEALQFTMQIPTNMGRYMRNIAFGAVDLLPGERYTPAGVNRRAHEEMRGRLADGKLAPFTAHPAAARADGHVLLAYAMRETADAVEYDYYDSNYPPVGTRARSGKLVFSKADWTYELRNHAGRAVYTAYELITPLRPDRAYERQVFKRVVTHLDEYLRANELVFDGLARGQRAWRYLSEDLGGDLKERSERARARARGLWDRVRGN